MQVYISYAWKDREQAAEDSREAIVDKLCRAAQQRGYTIIRDKTDMQIGDSIRKFIREIGKGDVVLMVISKKYLFSDFCMAEATEAFRYGDINERLLPIVLQDANPYLNSKQQELIQYWNERSDKLKKQHAGDTNSYKSGAIAYDEKPIHQIAFYLEDVMVHLPDLLRLSPEVLLKENFTTILDHLEQLANRADQGLVQKILPLNRKEVRKRMPPFRKLFSFLFPGLINPKAVLKACSHFDYEGELEHYSLQLKHYIPVTYTHVADEEGERFAFPDTLAEKLCNETERDAYQRIQKFYMILGGTGYGKTLGMLRLLYELVRRHAKKRVVYSTFYKSLKPVYEISKEEKKRTVLLLDGLDEHPRAFDDTEHFWGEIERNTQDFAQVIITCRKQFFSHASEERQYTDTNPQYPYKRYNLSLIEKEKVKNYILRQYPPVRGKPEEYQEALRLYSNIPNLLERPLFFMHIDTLINGPVQLPYKTSYHSVKAMVGYWIQREEKLMKERLGFKKDYASWLWMFSLQLAVKLYKLNAAYIRDYQFSARIQKMIIPGISAMKARDRTLLQRTRDGRIRFAHRMFKEFFLARALWKGFIDEKRFPFDEFPDTQKFYNEMAWSTAVDIQKTQAFRNGGVAPREEHLHTHLEQMPADLDFVHGAPPDDKITNIHYGNSLPNAALRALVYLGKGIPAALPDFVFEVLEKAFIGAYCINAYSLFNRERVGKLAKIARIMMQNENNGIPLNELSKMEPGQGYPLQDIYPYFQDDGEKAFFVHPALAEFFALYPAVKWNEDTETVKSLLFRFRDLFRHELNWLHYVIPYSGYLAVRSEATFDSEELQQVVRERDLEGWWPYIKEKAKSLWDAGKEMDYMQLCADILGQGALSLRLLQVPDEGFWRYLPYGDKLQELDLTGNTFTTTLDLQALKNLQVVYADKAQQGFLQVPAGTVIQTKGQQERKQELVEIWSQKALHHEMVAVEGEHFIMGEDSPESDADELTHPVAVHSFRIARYPVTLGEFGRFVVETEYKTTADKQGWILTMESPQNKGKGIAQRDANWQYTPYGQIRNKEDHNRPVVFISWYDAIAYCNWLSRKEGLQPCYSYAEGETIWDNWPENWNTEVHNHIRCDFDANGYRLPTEAEWEYAARGGMKSKGYTYAGSNTIDEVAEYHGNNNRDTQVVGKRKPNELGLYDMSGNVWEWCWDWYDSDYYKNSPKDNPKGPEKGPGRVLRGGSWRSSARAARVAGRNRFDPEYRLDNFGFRLCRTD